MPTVSFGKADGSHIEAPLYADDRFELVGEGNYSRQGLPIAYTGLSIGSGALDNYPAKLEDGLLLSATDLSSRYTAAERTQMGFGGIRGTDFFDFAANADDQSLYMVWNVNTSQVTGANGNPLHTYNTGSDPYDPVTEAAGPDPAIGTPVIDPNYDAGAFPSYSTTGIFGVFNAWLSQKHLNDDIAGYSVNDRVKASKGKTILLGLSGSSIGRVERVHTFSNGVVKVRIRFTLNDPQIIA